MKGWLGRRNRAGGSGRRKSQGALGRSSGSSSRSSSERSVLEQRRRRLQLTSVDFSAPSDGSHTETPATWSAHQTRAMPGGAEQGSRRVRRRQVADRVWPAEGSGAAPRGKAGGPTELRSATMVAAAAVKAGSKEPCAGSAAARLYILASMQLCACATTWHDGQTPDGKQGTRSRKIAPRLLGIVAV